MWTPTINNSENNYISIEVILTTAIHNILHIQTTQCILIVGSMTWSQIKSWNDFHRFVVQNLLESHIHYLTHCTVHTLYFELLDHTCEVLEYYTDKERNFFLKRPNCVMDPNWSLPVPHFTNTSFSWTINVNIITIIRQTRARQFRQEIMSLCILF